MNINPKELHLPEEALMVDNIEGLADIDERNPSAEPMGRAPDHSLVQREIVVKNSCAIPKTKLRGHQKLLSLQPRGKAFVQERLKDLLHR